jgi:opacity protein-like surface antigen
MRLTKLCLMTGLALAATTATVHAADWDRGGSIKDRGGVPVPAPVPIMETYKWYLRADVGGGVTDGPKASTSPIYGLDRDPLDGPAFGATSSWFTGDFDKFATFGVGVGAYLTPRLRGDITVDVRSKGDAHIDRQYSYMGDPAIYDPSNAGTRVRIDGDTREHTEVRSTVALANLYWDLVDRGTNRFVPYVGAGLGFAVRSIDRRHGTIEQGIDVTDPANPVNLGYRGFAGNGKAHQLAFAASATAGLAYNLSQGTVIDISYRYTYIGGVDFDTSIAFSQPIDGQTGAMSKLSIGDTQEHAIRAGLRWNVW